MLRNALTPLLPDLRLAFIYGSVAKGSATAASDIDLLLVGDHLLYGELLSALALAEEILGRKISPTPYTLAEFKKKTAGTTAFSNAGTGAS